MRQGCLHADAGETAVEPVQMLAQAEGARTIDRKDFIDRIAEQKRTVEGRHSRLRQGQVSAVKLKNGKGYGHQANHSRMVSISRRHQPPAATSFRGCRGRVARL